MPAGHIHLEPSEKAGGNYSMLGVTLEFMRLVGKVSLGACRVCQ